MRTSSVLIPYYCLICTLSTWQMVQSSFEQFWWRNLFTLSAGFSWKALDSSDVEEMVTLVALVWYKTADEVTSQLKQAEFRWRASIICNREKTIEPPQEIWDCGVHQSGCLSRATHLAFHHRNCNSPQEVQVVSSQTTYLPAKITDNK